MTGSDGDSDWDSFDVPSIPWRRVAVAGAVVLGLVVAVTRFFLAVGDDDEDGDQSSPPADDGADVVTDPSVLLPQLDELIEDAELPAGPAGGLTVGDRGVTIVADRFDATSREGTFAALVENPHRRWQAENVEVRVDLVADDGTVVDTRTSLIDVVRPGQTAAVAGVLVDVSGSGDVSIEPHVEVARWREIEPDAGAIEVSEVETMAAPLTGVTTTAVARSTFQYPLGDVVVVAVHRRADGSIIGGFDTGIDLIEPGGEVEVIVDLPTNIDVADIASTEVYATGSRRG